MYIELALRTTLLWISWFSLLYCFHFLSSFLLLFLLIFSNLFKYTSMHSYYLLLSCLFNTFTLQKKTNRDRLFVYELSSSYDATNDESPPDGFEILSDAVVVGFFLTTRPNGFFDGCLFALFGATKDIVV